jgi:hypothetical protein
MAEDNEKVMVTDWNEEARMAFSDFRRTKRSLPSPPTAIHIQENSKKIKSLDLKEFRLNNIANRKKIYDSNRFSLNHECNESKDESAIQSSTFAELQMSIDGESEFDKTEVMCDGVEKNIAVVREMIKNKVDAYAILEKITDDFADYYKKSRELINKLRADTSNRVSHLNKQVVTLENNLYDKINIIHEKSDERLNAIEVSHKCSREINFLWISFADPKEIESLRLKNKSELIREAKVILSRMNIWTNGINRQILDVIIQKVAIKVDRGFTNEAIMGIRFMNNATVLELKRLIIEYAKKQFMIKNYDSVRYFARDNWSPMIWKLLRVCYDLSSLNLIESAYVSDSGINVCYKNTVNENGNNNETLSRVIVRTESDIDKLRQMVGDIACDIPTFRIYDGNYFKLGVNERKLFKESLKKELLSAEMSPETNSNPEASSM